MKRLYATLILALLGGCGEPENPGPANPARPMLSGQIADWTRGAGYRVEAAINGPSGRSAIVASDEVSASGSFSFALPDEEAVAPHLSPTLTPQLKKCRVQPAIAPPALQSGSLLLNVRKPGEAEIFLTLASWASTVPPTPGDQQADLLYAAQDGSISGRTECETSAGVFINENSVQLSKGWNTVVTKYQEYGQTPSGLRVVVEARNGEQPAAVKWRTTR